MEEKWAKEREEYIETLKKYRVAMEEYIKKEFSECWTVVLEEDYKLCAYTDGKKRYELYFDGDTQSWMINKGKFVCLDMINEVIEIFKLMDRGFGIHREI